MAANPTGIAQVAIAVGDVERAKAFYRDVLGLTHLFDAPPALAFLQCGGTRLMLSRPEGSETVGNSILYYSVADIEAAHGAMVEAGVSFEEPPRRIATVAGRDVWLAVCRDSEGNLLGLMSEVDAV
jgi:methylmalonyl-CoA/ethylmalonyl-CoA epimerase